ATTTVKLNDDLAILVDSQPFTGGLDLGASVHTSYATQPLDVPLFDKEVLGGHVTGKLTGHYGVPVVDRDAFQVAMSRIPQLEIRPGAKASYLTTGLRGDFGNVRVGFGGLTITPDVLAHLTVSYPGPDFDTDLVKLGAADTVHGVRFH